jgi:hypothetical protein
MIFCTYVGRDLYKCVGHPAVVAVSPGSKYSVDLGYLSLGLLSLFRAVFPVTGTFYVSIFLIEALWRSTTMLAIKMALKYTKPFLDVINRGCEGYMSTSCIVNNMKHRRPAIYTYHALLSCQVPKGCWTIENQLSLVTPAIVYQSRNHSTITQFS